MDDLQRLENLTLPTRVRDLQMQNRCVCIYACTYLRTTSHAEKNNFYPEPTKFPFNSHSLNCQQKSLFSAVERINVSPLHRYSFFVRFRCAFAIDTSTIKHTFYSPLSETKKSLQLSKPEDFSYIHWTSFPHNFLLFSFDRNEKNMNFPRHWGNPLWNFARFRYTIIVQPFQDLKIWRGAVNRWCIKEEKKKKKKKGNFPIGPSEKGAYKRASRQVNLQLQSLPWNRAVSNVSQSWSALRTKMSPGKQKVEGK